MLAGIVAFLAPFRPPVRRQPETIRTTLYDLIATMQDGIGPEDDAWIVNTVTNLICTGHIRFLDEMESSRSGC
jgi:hypothetical protein